MYPGENDEVVQLYLDDIIPNRFQPREVFDEKALKELAVSIKEHGVIQPIIVRKVNEKYEIIAGERRYKASALAGLTKIPAIIRDLDDKESSKVALLENLQRKNLNPIEEARTYQKILEIDQMTQEQLARTMGKSQSAVANKIRLLSLPEEIQEALLKEEISERHARTLLNIPDAKKQKEMLKKVIDNKMSVKNLEDEIKSLYPKGESQTVTAPVKEEVIATASDFVNSNPLIPTAEIPEETSNYGKVVIAPPEGESMPTGKYINYGEIEKDEEKEIDNSLNIPTQVPSVDINAIKENATDINTAPGNEAALDNLLNLNLNNVGTSNDYITPGEKIVKTDTAELDDEQSDYFQTPDLSSLQVASPVIPTSTTPETSSIFELEATPQGLPESDSSTPAPSKDTITVAVDKIRILAEELKSSGLGVTLDEMDFDNTYQIIIKIDKES
ncbi:MAG: ParB/RepB/Spo0J family partition protein [Bacilli bacterium]|nr:ParB/RepB/Spo0J family partition protein [Bacilli bacterium]